MTDTKPCSVCQFENPINAAVCGRCFTALVPLLPASTTLTVAETEVVPVTARVPHFSKLPPNMIELQLTNQKQPLLLQIAGELILGRDPFTQESPAVDLTPFNAVTLGVSRRHAVIQRTDSGYSLTDLSSTNGSWLNDLRLQPNQVYPLNSGDQIRLSRLALHVYFSQALVSTKIIRLRGDRGKAIILTPDYLMTQVGPYLKAVSTLQALLDKIRGQATSRVTIQTIEHENGTLAIKLEGAAEVIYALNQVAAWLRKQRATQYLEQAKAASAVGGKTEQLALESQPPPPITDEKLRQLALDILYHTLPAEHAQRAATSDFPNRLVPPLRALTDGALSLIGSDD